MSKINGVRYSFVFERTKRMNRYEKNEKTTFNGVVGKGAVEITCFMFCIMGVSVDIFKAIEKYMGAY